MINAKLIKHHIETVLRDYENEMTTTIIGRIRLARAGVSEAYENGRSALYELGAIFAHCQTLADINPGIDVWALTDALSDLNTDMDDYLKGVGL